MATVLLTWELGGGIGHLMSLRPLGEELVRRGHRVVAAVRDLTNVAEIFAGSGISFMPAPIVPRRGPPPYEPTAGFAQILGNIGFASESILATLLSAWNTIFDAVRPDLVVADHSPTTLLALWGRPIRRVNVGLGFFCPPDLCPLPIWAPPQDPLRGPAARDEETITATVNRVLASLRRPALQRLAQIFKEVNETFLATYREFDHFGPRPNVRYWGHWPFGAATAVPQWPAGSGPKIYAYLKPFPGLEGLLTAIKEQGLPTLILSGGIEPAMQERFAGPNLRFEPRPLDLRLVAEPCDLAILMAGHGTAAALLLAGKPCLLVPPFLEQLLLARKMEQTGAARVLSKEPGAPAAKVLQEMLSNPGYRVQAQAFAARYAGFRPGQQVAEVVDHLDKWCRGPVVRLARIPAR